MFSAITHETTVSIWWVLSSVWCTLTYHVLLGYLLCVSNVSHLTAVVSCHNSCCDVTANRGGKMAEYA